MNQYGDCVITRYTDAAGDDRLRIDKADEHIRIAPDLLEQVEREAHPDVTITDGTLRITAANRTVGYALGELVLDQHNCLWRLADRVDP